MKELLLSNCEKSFVKKCIEEGKRLDGRSLSEFRDVRINFGNEWGSVHVSLGDTRVLAQVSCDVMQPKSTRPNEGLLHLNIELGPMAAPHLEAARQSDLSVYVNRILERALKDSRAVDLESLCIVADEKVWNLRVDINVLNHEGNIIDCASVAALAALSHFKRPDVTTSGDEFIIHTHAEKDPIPIPLHHYPVCVSYGIFNGGLIAIADQTALEERVAEANIVFGLNSYKELCGLHLGGITLTSSQLLLKCANKAAERAKFLVEKIKAALEEDKNVRAQEDAHIGFHECIRLNQITTLAQDRMKLRLQNFDINSCSTADYKDMQMDTCDPDPANSSLMLSEPQDDVKPNVEIKNINRDSAVLLPKSDGGKPAAGTRKWVPDDEDESQSGEASPPSSDSDVQMVEPDEVVMPAKKRKSKKTKAQPAKQEAPSSSEEDETIVLSTTV